MAKAKVNVNISPAELRKTIAQIDKWGEDRKKLVRKEVASSAFTIQREAKRGAPVDTGQLRAAIAPEFTQNKLGARILVRNVKHAPYREFGTGDLVKIPKGFDAYAAQFKGKGIRKVNSKAQPHLIPAFVDEQPKFVARVKKILGIKK